MYGAYALTGLGGIFTISAKEGITYLVQGFDLVDERYVPHSLYSEMEHTGLIRNLPSMQGKLLPFCRSCGLMHVASVCPGSLSHLPAPAPMRHGYVHRSVML